MTDKKKDGVEVGFQKGAGAKEVKIKNNNGIKAEPPENKKGSQTVDFKDAEAPTPTPDRKEIEQKLQKSEEEARRHYDQLLRISAEFENYKKRMTREMDDYRKYANESILREFLTVIDNLEMAVNSSFEKQTADNSVTEGINLTLAETRRIMTKFGVEEIEADNKPFDPNYHQAFMQEENNELPENTVVRVFQKGYLLHNRLLRPSMVVVSTTNSDTSPDSSSNDPQDLCSD